MTYLQKIEIWVKYKRSCLRIVTVHNGGTLLKCGLETRCAVFSEAVFFWFYRGCFCEYRPGRSESWNFPQWRSLGRSHNNLYIQKKSRLNKGVSFLWGTLKRSAFWRWTSTSGGKSPKRRGIGNARGHCRRSTALWLTRDGVLKAVSSGKLPSWFFWFCRLGCLPFISAESGILRHFFGRLWRYFMVLFGGIRGCWCYRCCSCRRSGCRFLRCWFWRVPVGIWKLLSKLSLFVSVLISSFRIFSTNDALIVFCWS